MVVCLYISDKGPFHEVNQVLIHLSNYLIELISFKPTTTSIVFMLFFFGMQLYVIIHMILLAQIQGRCQLYLTKARCVWRPVRGQRPRTYTADREPVTWPMRNHLNNDILLINY